MEYKRFVRQIVARIDKDEEIIAVLHKIALAENIKLASISAIGAIKEVKIGCFKAEKQKYVSNIIKGDYEITSLIGNINTLNNEFYTHLHINIADEKHCFGGHLNYAIIGATCEMIITIIDGVVDRTFDKTIGLNVLKF